MSESSLDLNALHSAIGSLSGGLEVVNNAAWFTMQPPMVRNTLIAGVIQNFEFVYEISVKMIRRRMELDALSPEEVDAANFRELLRSAGEKGLIADVEAWFKYRRMRKMTSHTYDQSKADEIFRGIGAFLTDARLLLTRLEARNV